MAIDRYPTPMIDQLEEGPWPSFISGIKRLRDEHPEQRINEVTASLLGQLEHSYETRKGYWKGGTVSVYGYGGGIIPRFTELKDENEKPIYPAAAEFHTLRVMPPPGMHYDTDTLRKFCDIWEKYGSGLTNMHGSTGDIIFLGSSTEALEPCFAELSAEREDMPSFDLGGSGSNMRTPSCCVGPVRRTATWPPP